MPDALTVAYTYLNRRERTVAEVRARLAKAECPEPEAEAAIAELLELSALDDARYARVFIEDKRSLESWGTERIQRALLERGIERDVVAAALTGAGGEAAGGAGQSELDRALELLSRRFPVPGEDPRERDRAFGMLVRKGYESEVAADAVRAWARGADRPVI
jgi:regulatory protein